MRARGSWTGKRKYNGLMRALTRGRRRGRRGEGGTYFLLSLPSPGLVNLSSSFRPETCTRSKDRVAHRRGQHVWKTKRLRLQCEEIVTHLPFPASPCSNKRACDMRIRPEQGGDGRRRQVRVSNYARGEGGGGRGRWRRSGAEGGGGAAGWRGGT